tara:strand:- start:5212 stop:6189 length:978 start_codon:yes stop_codon:yes gene_type:complete
MGKHSERVTCKARISITTCATPASVTPDFISAASGEWEGHKVYFDADGTAEPIPEKFMPPAFKEWGQVLVDWQSQCAMNVTTDGGLYARELRFIPTAGCEADSSTVETQWDRNVDLTNITPAVVRDGCSIALGSYSTGPTDLSEGSSAQECNTVTIEHCLHFDDAPSKKNPEGKRSRVRVQQKIKVEENIFALEKITVWKEFYYEPFNNAVSLCSSCGGPNKWGEYPVLPVDVFLEGVWGGDAWAGFGGALGDVVLLPTGIYSKVTTSSSGELTSEAGWFIPDRDASYLPPSRDVESHLVSQRTYGEDGKLADASFAKRERQAAK